MSINFFAAICVQNYSLDISKLQRSYHVLIKFGVSIISHTQDIHFFCYYSISISQKVKNNLKSNGKLTKSQKFE